MATTKKTAKAKGSGSKSTDNRVRELAKLLEETGLSEIEIEQNGIRVRVVAGGLVAAVAQPVAAAAPAAPGSPPAAADEPAGAHPGTVNSPMVGTAFVAAEPGGSPFIQAGDQVQAGQTMLIIEAMKVMNPIPAPKAGKVIEILISDGEPVEFGQPLLVIE